MGEESSLKTQQRYYRIPTYRSWIFFHVHSLSTPQPGGGSAVSGDGTHLSIDPPCFSSLRRKSIYTRQQLGIVVHLPYIFTSLRMPESIIGPKIRLALPRGQQHHHPSSINNSSSRRREREDTTGVKKRLLVACPIPSTHTRTDHDAIIPPTRRPDGHRRQRPHLHRLRRSRPLLPLRQQASPQVVLLVVLLLVVDGARLAQARARPTRRIHVERSQHLHRLGRRQPQREGTGRGQPGREAAQGGGVRVRRGVHERAEARYQDAVDRAGGVGFDVHPHRESPPRMYTYDICSTTTKYVDGSTETGRR